MTSHSNFRRKLKVVLTSLRAQDVDASVVVKGAAGRDRLPSGVVSVLDIIQQVDITKVGLATETQ